MATPPTVPQVDINTPAAQIAQVNAESQQTPTPGQPRNPDGTFASPPPPAQVQPPAAPAVPAPYSIVEEAGKVKITFADLPEVYEGANHQEALAKAAEALYNTKKYAQTLKQAVPPVPQVQPPPATPQTPFADPAEAATANYVLDLIAKSMNLPNGEALKAQMGFVTENTADYASQTTALAFQAAQPDFNPTNENAEKIMNVIYSSGIGNAFDAAPRDQQVQMLRQAHAYCLMSKIYDAKPSTAANPSLPAPPPPAPSSGARPQAGQLPQELVATVNDSLQEIQRKHAEAVRLGYIQ